MDRLRAAGARRSDDAADVEVALARGRRTQAPRLIGRAHMAGPGIGIRIHRHRAQPEAPRGAEDAAGDLAAVGDQQALDHADIPSLERPYIRSTPKRCGSSAGALRTAASDSASTRGVSCGSMTPSSHSRAEE